MSTKSGEGAPTALNAEGLLGKSKVYILRALRSKESRDMDEYQLWASLALELLGKAALAKIHPSLVADPTHFDTLLAASGITVSTDFKTITSNTLYLRLQKLSRYFDKSVFKFCNDISLRRNAELHSGEAPFKEMRLEAWEPKYWHAAQIILDLLELSLEEWLGADQALAPARHVKEAHEATIQAALKRVEYAKESFAKRKSGDRTAAIEESKIKSYYHYPTLFRSLGDNLWPVECPACTGRAFLSGMTYDEEVMDDSEADEEEVVKYYGAEQLRCPVCDLHLDSREEIEAAGIDPDHEEIETREREYEPDYGNC